MAIKIIHNKIFWLVVAGILVAGLATAFIFRERLLDIIKTISGTNAPLAIPTTPQQTSTNVSTVANNVYYTTGDLQGALQVYDNAVKKSSDKNTIASMYVSKGILLLNARQYADALLAGQQAESFVQTNESAMVIAEGYAGIGDKQKAITEYKIAIERAKALVLVNPPNSSNVNPNKKQSNVPDTSSAATNTFDSYSKRLKELES